MGLKLNLIFLLIAIGACSSHAERISEQKCKEYGQTVLKKQVVPSPLPGGEPTVVYNSNCQHEEVPLIFGGTKAAKYEFPHQAILKAINLTTQEPDFVCGGSLISSRFVLSAAHCYQPPGYSPVKYINLGMNKQSDNVHVYDVEDLYPHQNYESSSISNDIMVIKLTEEVKINEFVMPICLPTKQHTNSKAIVSGFGATEYASESNDLLKVTVDRFTHNECERNYGRLNEDTKLCYGHRTRSKDSCYGDSGGPLQVYNDVDVPCTYKVIGIVSYGRGCGIPGLPGVYTNVYHYLDWIEKIVWGSSSSSSSSSSED